MKTNIILLATLGIASAASAQTVDQRHHNQQARILQGVRSGELTPAERRHDENQQRSIDHQEQRMRARDGGALTGYDRKVLQKRENNASADIEQSKNNDKHKN